jgi:hypothetical protein
MSPDSEDTALEEALRDDLPSAETSARLRRRLLAAGLAIGNGAAASTAAAAAGAGAGVVSKGGLALSWGFKLGALAVVAIPSVGLLVESQAEPQLAPPPSSVAAPAGKPRSPERATLPSPAAPAVPLKVDDEVAPVAPPVARPSRAESDHGLPAPTRHEGVASAPSQVDFAPTDAASAAKAASTLAEETRLLDSAFAELSAGRAARARELVAEHQRRFPNGLLQKERERARVRLSEMSRGE